MCNVSKKVLKNIDLLENVLNITIKIEHQNYTEQWILEIENDRKKSILYNLLLKYYILQVIVKSKSRLLQVTEQNFQIYIIYMKAYKLLNKEVYYKKSWIIFTFYSNFYLKRHFEFQMFLDKFGARNWTNNFTQS